MSILFNIASTAMKAMC